MQENFYTARLYPVQDRILRLLATVEATFYLTGGTALSRIFLHHRYSDDLDFFCNDDPAFRESVDRAVRMLEGAGIHYAVDSASTTFMRVLVHETDLDLKIDFVNDVPYRAHEILSDALFPRVDHPLNILSNKISALPRQEAKDVVDILGICTTFSFQWPEIFQEAKKKDHWIDELEVVRTIQSFPLASLDTVRWIGVPDTARIEQNISVVAADIVNGGRNTLAPPEND